MEELHMGTCINQLSFIMQSQNKNICELFSCFIIISFTKRGWLPPTSTKKNHKTKICNMGPSYTLNQTDLSASTGKAEIFSWVHEKENLKRKYD